MSTASRLLSTAAAAQLLGVDPRTVIRWVDDDKLPAVRTEGGHRRIAEADLLAFKARNQALPAAGARVIVVANQKGGVLKTTITANLGVLLHQAGARVLVVGLDPQGHLELTLGFDPDTLTETVYDAMLRPQRVPLPDVIRETTFGPDLAPINIAASNVDADFSGKPLWGSFLQKALALVRDRYDYILIDSPPNLDKLTVTAFLAADYVLIPTQLQRLSVWGLNLLLSRIDEAQTAGNARLQIAGVVATMAQSVESDKAMDQALRTALQGRAIRLFHTAIPFSAAYKDVANAGTVMAFQRPRGVHTRPYRQLLAELLDVVGGPIIAQSVLTTEPARAAVAG